MKLEVISKKHAHNNFRPPLSVKTVIKFAMSLKWIHLSRFRYIFQVYIIIIIIIIINE
jgi:hypothetical protein